MRTLLEFLVAAGLALLFHFGLRLEHEAYVLFGVGVLLTLAVHLIVDRANQLHHKTYEAVGRMTRFDAALERITDPEGMIKGREVIDTAQHVLTLLGQGSIPLTEGEYYYEASRCLTRCSRTIAAVNSVDITDWMGKVQKQNYYREQVAACRRGVTIARIFVIRRQDLANQDVLCTIRHQHEDGITVRVALHEDLAFSGREGITMPTNFVLFDDHVLIARTPLLGMYYGKKSHAGEEIERCRRVYDILDQHARPLQELIPTAVSSVEPLTRAS